MVKPTCLFLANLFKTGHYQVQSVFLGKIDRVTRTEYRQR